MYLGIIASTVGIVYALVRFATMVRLRHLRESLARAQFEIRRSEQRLEALQGRLQVERARRVSLLEKAEAGRRRAEEQYARLRGTLAPELRPELRRCRALHPAPDPDGEKILHDLKLADEIAATLGSLSLLVVLLPGAAADTPVHTVLLRLLAGRGVRYHSPTPEVVISAFEQPQFGFAVARELVEQAPPEQLPALRGALFTGLHYPPGKSEINQLLLRLLRHAVDLARQAPPGLLLLNEHARQRLEAQSELLFFDPGQSLYAFAWTQPTGVGAS